MKKILTLLLVGAIFLGLTGCGTNKDKNPNINHNNSVTKNYKAEDLIKLSNDVHAKVEKKPFVETLEIDINDKDLLKMTTGLKSNTNVEYVTRTEAMIGSQAYSFVLVKASDSADIEAMKKEMIDNIDLGKWICVFANVVYTTNYENIIMLVMGDTKVADVDAIYAEFEKAANNNVGKKLERLSGN